MRQLWHLVTRFLGSLSPRPLAADDAAWVDDRLMPGERALWARMSRADQKHAAGVAREVDRVLDGAPRPVLAAALLHDVGKIESGLGTWSRSVATVVAAVFGRARVGEWAGRRGIRGRFASYVTHDRLGAELLRAAGSDELTASWAGEHHLPPHHWTIPSDTAHVLAAADDD